MSEPQRDEIQELIDSLEPLRGEPLLVRLQEIVEAGKRRGEGDVVAAFAKHLIEAGSALGRLDYEMIGFGEIQSLYLRDARYADLRTQVLWYFKWLCERLPEYVEVPAEQVWGTLDRMEQFYRTEHEGVRPVHGLRSRAAALMGFKGEAATHFDLWEAAAKHASDDCPACETHLRVETLLDQQRFEEAFEAAGPIIDGSQSCDEVPATTFSRLLVPLLWHGRDNEAGFMCMAVQRLVRVVPKLIGYLADHVIFLTLAGGLVRAARLTFLMTARVPDTFNAANRFAIWRAAWIHYAVLRRLGATEVNVPHRDLAAPAHHHDRPHVGSRLVPIDEAIAQAERHTRDLAAAFDRRNGTDRFAKRVEFAESIANPPADETAAGKN